VAINFKGPAIFVADINRSRSFYENILEQEVETDNGRHVAFKGGLFIWQTDVAFETIYKQEITPESSKSLHTHELYFESKNIHTEWERVKNCCDTILNELAAAPWMQLGFRILDPDGHIVEIGEALPRLIQRLYEEGMSVDAIHQSTSFPVEFIHSTLGL